MNYWILVSILLAMAWMLWRKRGVSKEQLAALLAQGAQVIDVRTSGEFRGGHVAGSKNIPLENLQNRAGELDRARPVLLCCASGSRSAMAVSMLKGVGFTEVYNAGSWTVLK